MLISLFIVVFLYANFTDYAIMTLNISYKLKSFKYKIKSKEFALKQAKDNYYPKLFIS